MRFFTLINFILKGMLSSVPWFTMPLAALNTVKGLSEEQNYIKCINDLTSYTLLICNKVFVTPRMFHDRDSKPISC